MAIVTLALQASLTAQLGAVPPMLATAISSLTAQQRDDFVTAWVNAPIARRAEPPAQWMLREEDRAAFAKFQTAINLGTS